MLGRTHKGNRGYWLRLKLLAIAVVGAAVFAAPASARPDEGSAKLTEASSGYLNASPGRSIMEGDVGLAAEIANLSHGGVTEGGTDGVTPTNLARKVEWEALGGVTPTNLARVYDSRRVDEPALIRDVPDGHLGDVRTSDPVTVLVSGQGSFDERALAIGFGLGSALVAAAVAVLMLSRGRMRLAP